MYENIVCRYEALVSTKHLFIVVVILQENHVDIQYTECFTRNM
jgi:hypothetical protein